MSRSPFAANYYRNIRSYEGKEPPKLPNLLKRKTVDDIVWGGSGKDARFLAKFRRLLGRVDESDRKLLLHTAQKMGRPRAGRR